MKAMKNRIICKKVFFPAILALCFLGWVQGARGQEYPRRSIAMLISYAPGAGTDLCGRMISLGAKKILGQEIIPVNKPGGGGTVMMGILASAKGDGYTLGAASETPLVKTPHIESVAYDPLKDIIPVIQFGDSKTAIIVRSDSPHRSFKDLIDFARKNPGKISFGTTGIGTGNHLAMEYVSNEEKVNIAIIPFDGSTPTMTALLGGHVSACGTTTSGFLQHLKAGKVRVLATTTDKRIAAVPDAPTLIELGYPYGDFTGIYLIVAPKGIPPAVLKKLEGAFRKAMQEPEFKTLADNLKMYEENPLSGQELKTRIERQYVRFGEIIRKTNIVSK